MEQVTFNEQLTRTLEHFTDPHWLETHSPLCAPYFLGEYLLKRKSHYMVPSSNGRVLQELLRSTAHEMRQREQENDAYYYQILDLSFFRPISFRQIADQLGVSRATYYRHRRDAIKELEVIFIQRIKPALRLERPPLIRSHKLIGRQEIVKTALPALRQGQSIALTGQSGSGKTTLGAYLANQWELECLFWYTFRPGLNDQLSSLLFSLGYFLHNLDTSSLWLQLVADQGKIDSQLMLNLMQRDLANLSAHPILLCFDEIGLLHPTETDAHAQIYHFIHSLQTSVAILFIGQQIPIEPDNIYVIEGFSRSDSQQLLTQANIRLSAEELTQLQQYTGGNPRLLELFITLHQSGRSLKGLLAQLSAPPTVEFLLRRILTYLEPSEQQLLTALSVFWQPAPGDAWQAQGALHKLQARYLVRIDEQGQVSLLPAVRTIIYHTLSSEERETYHQAAAVVRAERGEYTLAAYHYIRANQPEHAIQLWYTHKQQEIDQGQGQLALEIFTELSHKPLPKSDKHLLILLRNELRLLFGDYTRIKPELMAMDNPDPLLKSEAYRLIGDVELERSKFQASIDAYRQGITNIYNSDLQLAQLYTKSGFAYQLKRELDVAWRESLFARYEVEHLQGDVQYYKGNYEAAEAHFQAALSLAERLNYAEGEGKTRNGLALLLLDKGAYGVAQHHWQIAKECYGRVGRLTWVAGIQVNQAIAYTQQGAPEEAIPLLRDSLSVYGSLNHARGRAAAKFNLAKAYLALNDLDRAHEMILLAYDEGEPGLEPAALCVLAEIKLSQDILDEAIRFAEQAIEAARRNQDLLNEAYAWRILGHIYVAQKVASAPQAIEQAVSIFEALELPQEVEQTKDIFNLLEVL